MFHQSKYKVTGITSEYVLKAKICNDLVAYMIHIYRFDRTFITPTLSNSEAGNVKYALFYVSFIVPRGREIVTSGRVKLGLNAR